jgi:hypothetical protein
MSSLGGVQMSSLWIFYFFQCLLGMLWPSGGVATDVTSIRAHWVLVIVDSPGASVDNKMVHMLSTNEAESGELLDDQEGGDGNSDDGDGDTWVPLQSA